MMRLIYIFMLVILTSCAAENSEASKDVLYLASSGEPASLDPFDQLDGYSLQVRAQIYDTLLIRNPDNSFSPALAKSWKFISPKKIRFDLRDDVTFHNGEKFGPKDVKYTIERQQSSIPNRELYSMIYKVELLEEENAVIIYLTKPFAPFLAHMSLPNMYIVNKKAIESFGTERTSQAVGTGPYVFEEWARGYQVVLKANTNYFKGTPSIPTLILKVVPDESSRSIALETGDVGVVRELAYVDAERIGEDPKFDLLEFATPNVFYVSINTKKGIMADRRIREAIALAIDKEGIINNVYFGKGRVAGSMVPFNAFGHTNIIWEHNKAKAKALIEEAGATGQKLKMYLLNPQLRIAEIMQENLREIGLTLEINMLEPGAFFQLIKGNDHHLYISSWTSLTSDADYALSQVVTSTGSWNSTKYANPTIDEIISNARYEVDVEKRKAMYASVQAKLAEDIPYIPLFTIYGLNAKDKNIQNIQVVGGSSVLYLGDVYYTNQ